MRQFIIGLGSAIFNLVQRHLYADARADVEIAMSELLLTKLGRALSIADSVDVLHGGRVSGQLRSFTDEPMLSAFSTS